MSGERVAPSRRRGMLLYDGIEGEFEVLTDAHYDTGLISLSRSATSASSSSPWGAPTVARQ